MEWMQGPMSDQAVFWFGLQVFWYKRAITIVQLVLGGSLFLDLVNDQHKQSLSARLEGMKERAAGVVVPRVIRLRTLVIWFIAIVGSLSTFLAYLTHTFATSNGSPVPFGGALFLYGVVLTVIGFVVVHFVVAASMLRTTFHGFRKFAPPVLAWLFHPDRFDKTIRFGTFAALAAVTLLSLRLS